MFLFVFFFHVFLCRFASSGLTSFLGVPKDDSHGFSTAAAFVFAPTPLDHPRGGSERPT